MAAAFPGLQDRLEHLTSVIKPGDAVEVEKLDDEEAEAPISPPIVGDDDVAERTLPEPAIVDEPLANDSAALVVIAPPLCPDTVLNVVLGEVEAVADELIDVVSLRGSKPSVGDAVGNGGEMVMLESSVGG